MEYFRALRQVWQTIPKAFFDKMFASGRAFNARPSSIVDDALDPMLVLNGAGCIVTFNPACERLFGYGRHEVIGQNLQILTPRPQHEGDGGGNGAPSHKAGEQKPVGQRKDGSTFPIDVAIGETRQDGEPVFIGIIRDLSNTPSDATPSRPESLIAQVRRQRIQEEMVQVQRLEAVGQLSGGIAHDFNNLLTVIIGNSEMLADRLDERKDLKHLAEQILAAGQRGAELTQRLLSFGRKQFLSPADIDCNRLIDSMRSWLRRILPEDIRIITHLDQELAQAIVDPGQLEAALLNLAINARDAMPRGGCVTVTTGVLTLEKRYGSLLPEVSPGDYVMVAVMDDGEGMPPEVSKKAFEPFFTTRAVGKGSGLGLSMVYGFAKQSRGHVTLVSDMGLGTTVRIYLPASPHKSLVADEPPGDATVTDFRGEGVILAVEDDRFVLGYAAACLESLGYHVIVAVDGNDALARLESTETIDMLFSDVLMPGGMNGRELMHRAKKLRPNLKMLLTSGYDRDTLVSRGRVNSTLDVLRKPYRKADLARRVSEIMHGE